MKENGQQEGRMYRQERRKPAVENAWVRRAQKKIVTPSAAGGETRSAQAAAARLLRGSRGKDRLRQARKARRARKSFVPLMKYTRACC